MADQKKMKSHCCGLNYICYTYLLMGTSFSLLRPNIYIYIYFFIYALLTILYREIRCKPSELSSRLKIYICLTYRSIWEWKYDSLTVLYGNPALATWPQAVATARALAINFLGMLKVGNPPKRYLTSLKKGLGFVGRV